MVDRFASASAYVARRLASHGSQAVAYVRGALSIADLAATPTAATEEVDGLVVLTVEARRMDFLIAAADLAAGGLGLPAAGDRITWDRGDATETYEVLAGQGRLAYRREGPSGNVLRVHAAKV